MASRTIGRLDATDEIQLDQTINQSKDLLEEYPTMCTGTVKWFNNAKGYGFVKPDDREDDVFVHFSSIEMDGYKTLKEGQKVEFELSQGPKGLHAAKVQRAML